jgi:hypothetical protein
MKKKDWLSRRDRLKVVELAIGRFWKYTPFERYDASARTDRGAPSGDLFA